MSIHARRRLLWLWRALLLFGFVPIGWAGCQTVADDIASPRAGSETMRVTFATEGGVAYFPGLAKPMVIEADQLSTAEAGELGELVAAARFFDRPAQVAGAQAPGAADQRQYTITIEEGAQRHTVRVAEPIDNPELQRLVRFLESRVKALRAKRRPGAAP